MNTEIMKGSAVTVLTFRRNTEEAIQEYGFPCTEIVPQTIYMRGVISKEKITGKAFVIVPESSEEELALDVAQAFVDAGNACKILTIPEEQLKDAERSAENAAAIADAIAAVSTDSGAITAQSVARLMAGYDEYVLANQTQKPLETHFTRFDEAIGGGIVPRLYVVGGESSVGKTAFVLQCAEEIANARIGAGNPVLYFTQEMRAFDLIARGISRESKQQRYRADAEHWITLPGLLTEAQAAHGGQPDAEADYQNARTIYHESVGKNLYFFEGARKASEMRDVTRQFIAAHGRKPVVVVDYLQLTKPEDDTRASDRRIQIDESVQIFTDMRRELNTPVVVITSYNRASYGGTATLASAKESGTIEYSCDCLISLELRIKDDNGKDKKSPSQEELEAALAKEPREIRMKILKNRANRAGVKIYYEYDAAHNHYAEINPDTTPGWTPPIKDRAKTYKK